MQMLNSSMAASNSALLLDQRPARNAEAAPLEVVEDPRPVAGLLVMPPALRPAFLDVLRSLHVRVWSVATCREAREVLEASKAFKLVVTECNLPDGNWCDVLRSASGFGLAANVVVTTTEASERLWSELFWRGGYDLLVRPCGRDEMSWCLEGALRSLPPSKPAVQVWPAAS